MAIRHKTKLIIGFFLEFKKKIPASKSHSFTMRPPSTEAEGGRMVKEWDFEAGIFFKNSNKTQ